MSSDLEQQSFLARRLTLAMALPTALLLLLGLVLGRQILEMTDDASWVEHSDQVMATGNETLKEVIDQETGIRGFLLTNDRVFLEPFDRAHPEDGFRKLHELTADRPSQQGRFDVAKRRYEEWLAATKPATTEEGARAARSETELRERKAKMDATREAMTDAVNEEQTLRLGRVTTASASARTTKLVFFGLLVGAAAVLAFVSRRQLSSIATTFNDALAAEKTAREATEAETWVRAGRAKLVDAIQGDKPVDDIGRAALELLTAYVGADVGAVFVSEGATWRRRAAFGLDTRGGGTEVFEEDEGLVGRAAKHGSLLHLTDVPADYLKVRSGTGETSPIALAIVPGAVDGVVNAVLELGFLKPISRRSLDLLERVGESLATAIRSSEQKQRLRDLLEEAQRQGEELQTQQEELRVSNEELEAQTTALRTARSQLESQQAELEQTNDYLRSQSKMLEQQNEELADKQGQIETKAREVERTSQFKSEFLSNMSHELRTPLNSSLILAKLLADNKSQNLTPEQVRFAETIYAAGNDLLGLINDILDLSKIEAGKMDVRIETVTLDRVRDSLLRTFAPVADKKGVRFVVDIAKNAPKSLETDGQRLEQILKNLASNGLKFTERGAVTVTMSASGDALRFAVEDTGIGIPASQQGIIFEAFRQADGTTNRKYGGTGLGLSISRELAHLLGGELTVESVAERGSVFTLTVPRVYAAAPTSVAPEAISKPKKAESAPISARPDDEDDAVIEPGGRVVLIIEDDPAFASVLRDVAKEGGFQCLVAETAQRGFFLAKRHGPVGIVLDMKLPDHTGLSVLDRLKRDPLTRHIPVHVISATDYTETALAMGAAAYLLKPVAREQLVEAFRTLEARSARRLRRVLVVDDDQTLRESVAKLLGREDVQISTAESVAEALALLRENTFDCVVTDLGLPDKSGYELLETMAAEEPYSVPPVIVYTGRALTHDEETRLRRYSKSIIVKGARSPERLLDEVTLFLHQVESELPADQRRLLEAARHRDAVFEGRNVLVVEDDVRNIFALTSVLEPLGAKVIIARNGREALAALDASPVIDLVLMDIMMPEMDGLEATRRIRKNGAFAKLPIIALTAKAMRDDQERCIAAGANDYLAKPLDVEMLLSLLRVWMPKS